MNRGEVVGRGGMWRWEERRSEAEGVERGSGTRGEVVITEKKCITRVFGTVL